MSLHSDPSCRVPGNSFYNLAFRGDKPPFEGARQYYSDVVLECSSLMTPENMGRLEGAAGKVDGALTSALVDDEPLRLDETVATFQEDVGPELLSELRLGLDYAMAAIFGGVSLTAKLFTRDLDVMMFRKQIDSMSWTDTIWPSSPLRLSRGWPFSGVRIDDANCAGTIGHYASYLSNAAAWTRRASAPDFGTMHLFSLLLARSGANGDAARDAERCNEAYAVLAAEYLRSPTFLYGLGIRDSGDVFPYPNTILETARWDDSVVSLRGPVSRFVDKLSMFTLADFLQLCVDNRLVRTTETQRPVSVDHLFEPKLTDVGWMMSTGRMDAYLTVEQDRTKLMPRTASMMTLGKGTGVPVLGARSSVGYPAVLFPADDRTMKFLSRLYGVETPCSLKPMDSGDSALWSYVYDPMVLPDALEQFSRKPRFYGDRTDFAEGRNLTSNVAFSGTKDLAEYLPGVESTDMFVNELILY